jgi:hypothetical protein
MIFLLLAILVVLALTTSVAFGLFVSEHEGILNDEIIKEYLDRVGNSYKVCNRQYFQYIRPTSLSDISKDIERSPKVIRLVFPYYIEYVGVIPVWSKSKLRIDAMFATGVRRDFKRERLGLQ